LPYITSTTTILTPLPTDRLANLGGLRLRLHRRLHRRRSRHAERPPSSSSPNRRLRARLPYDRPPYLRRRNGSHLLRLRLVCRNIRLLARHLRNERAARLPQIPLPLHDHRYRVIHVLLARSILLLWAMGRRAISRIRRSDYQNRRVRRRVHWPAGLRLLVLARGREVRFCGCTSGLGAIAFILAQAIPIFNYLLSLTGSLCFAPIALSLPGWLWCHDNMSWRRGKFWQQIVFWITALMIPLGMFICIGGTYGVVVQIKDAYASGRIGKLMCRDDI
jgi:hypothetical protein